jgi:tetratricopeptide (TPR) repeat protein
LEYRVKGRYEEAEAAYRKALALAEGCFQPMECAMAQLLNDVAFLYKYTGQFNQAQQLYLRALKIAKMMSGKDLTILATVYHNIGSLEHARRCCRRAEVFARHSVVIREQALGCEHEDLAADLAALAAILEAQNKIDDAELLYRRALDVFERSSVTTITRLQ